MRNFSIIRTIAAGFALALAAGTAAYAQPKMEIVGGDTYDWGRVPPGKLTTVVQVKNVGDQDLKISEVRPACGCTAAPIDKNLLPPGDIGKISITLDVNSRSGPVEKTVTISSNDSTMPARILHLKADVHRAITCTPMQYMLVTDAKVGVESPASAVTIKNTSDAPFTLQKPELTGDGNFSARYNLTAAKVLKPGDEFELKAFITPKDETSLRGTIRVNTTNSETPSIDIPVNGSMSQTPAVSTPQISSEKQRK